MQILPIDDMKYNIISDYFGIRRELQSRVPKDSDEVYEVARRKIEVNEQIVSLLEFLFDDAV